MSTQLATRGTSRVAGETDAEYRRRYQRARYGALSQLATERRSEFLGIVRSLEGRSDVRNLALRELGRRYPERRAELLARHVNRSTAELILRLSQD